jgi:carbon monoxide dehydrogenase subunit G
MKVQGQQSLPLPQQAAFDLLLNTEVLARAMPGCESLLPIGPDEYQMNMKLAIAAMQGLFIGKIRIEDKNPPTSYRLVIEGSGKLGFIRGSGLLTLTPEPPGSQLQYSGDVQVGGLIASVGERMLDMTTKMMIRRFFDALLREAGAPASSG